MGGADASVATSPPPNLREADKARMLALHKVTHGRAVMDPSSGVVSIKLATLRSQAIQALSHPRKSIQVAATRSLIDAMQKSYQHPPLSRDIVCSRAHIATLVDDIFMSWVLHAKLATSLDKFLSLKEMKNFKGGWTPLCLLADTRYMSAQRQKAASARQTRLNELMMGQGPEQLTRVSTDILISSSIHSIDSIRTLLGGYTLICNSFIDFDPTRNSPDSPPLHNMSYVICEILNSAEFID